MSKLFCQDCFGKLTLFSALNLGILKYPEIWYGIAPYGPTVSKWSLFTTPHQRGVGVACKESNTVRIPSAGRLDLENLIHYLVINSKAFPIIIWEGNRLSTAEFSLYQKDGTLKNRHTERIFDIKWSRTKKEVDIRSWQITGNIRSAETMCPRNFSASGSSVLKAHHGICESEWRMSAMKCIQHLGFQGKVWKSTLTWAADFYPQSLKSFAGINLHNVPPKVCLRNNLIYNGKLKWLHYY